MRRSAALVVLLAYCVGPAAALRAQGETLVGGADAAVFSYPDFFLTLEEIVER